MTQEEPIMLSIHIRRAAATINRETGRPIQEILSEMVGILLSGVVDWEKRKCPFCGSIHSAITSTRSADEHVVRFHRCSFCTMTFRTMEKKSVKSTDEVAEPIAKPKRKPQNKKRGG